MFSFAFHKLKKGNNNWKLKINDHVIKCTKSNAKSISNKIFNYYSNKSINKLVLNENEDKDFFEIKISEFDDSLICSEQDYKYFDDIFNLIPVQISMTNKNVLKIFAKELEIYDLSKLIDIFEQSYDLITNDSILNIQKEITNEIIDITEENCDQLIAKIIEKYEEKDDNNFILDNDFLYTVVLSTCIIRSNKIELLMTFLKTLEEKTMGNQFKYFKKLILLELKESSTPETNEIRFIIRYLYNIHEIDQKTIEKVLGAKNKETGLYELYNFKDILFDKDTNLSETSIKYAKMGSNPDDIYQAIKNDDIDRFSELINQKSDNYKYNDIIQLDLYERSSFFMTIKSQCYYIDLSAFYGSEKVFNYILLNVDPNDCISEETVLSAFCGGNPSIIHKCIEINKLHKTTFSLCLLYSLMHHYNETFEWLIENHNSLLNQSSAVLINDLIDQPKFLETAVQFINFDALSYLISIGIDYLPLFSLSLIYNNFYLAKLSLKLQYNCNSSIVKTNGKRSPFLYEYKEIFFYHFFLT